MENENNRRNFLRKSLYAMILAFIPPSFISGEKSKKVVEWIIGENYNPYDHYWSMGIDINKCIGCGRCADACKTENDVPREPFFFRTWVERYRIYQDGDVQIDSPNGAVNGFEKGTESKNIERSFFVPKICNHCDNPPCVQVCPVGATFKSEDGVILVDKNYCIGCRYCIQACPYGARYLHPETRTADKCTFCYHRLVQGKLPACVETCPTQARIFGELKKKASPLERFRRMNKINVLKPALNTEPKVYYANLDMEVK
ncbi:MAG: 4Fe-4S dicluster domain-containing protein [Melioribacteraceae bacterium]|nr:4Fe-4S dicluster domain-containing protein [Melioribacteraceae bacterium]MCF8355574.1 4Fe-4S dicluster domain-containing protein [Melioribacteraceae bacterium]MCF8395047.1 4Fe-4S dicluster domain-containing protein [Melioribacteraceae bacterium]MCF8420501.1 4Fe-4S dicluster domain-containing protein [Melioribacteraceae bacterium]